MLRVTARSIFNRVSNYRIMSCPRHVGSTVLQGQVPLKSLDKPYIYELFRTPRSLSSASSASPTETEIGIFKKCDEKDYGNEIKER